MKLAPELNDRNEHDPVEVATNARPDRPFGAQFMTTYDTPVEGYDPSGVRSNWTTNEDDKG